MQLNYFVETDGSMLSEEQFRLLDVSKADRVLIDGSDLFLEYMRKNDYSADLIKKTIAEVTGTRYAIGPYKRKRQEEEARQSAEDVLSQLERQGVEIVYENE